MRNALFMAGSLLAVTACNGPDTQDQPMPAETAMAVDGAGMAGEQPPAAGQFAQSVAMSDMYEIAAAKIALERADGMPTRQFAQMMIDDHGKSTEALKQAVAQSGQTVAMPEALDAEHRAQVDILKTMNGPAFDREYLSQQSAAHRKALALLKSYGAAGDTAELRQFAQSTIPTVQMHAEWLDQNSPSPSATGGTPGATMGSTPVP
jgi:putative membrane protein